MILQAETFVKFGYSVDSIGKFSKHLAIVKCDCCETTFEKTLFGVNMARKNSRSLIDICSNIKCVNWKRTNTMLTKYGVENPIEIFSRLSRGRISKFQSNVYFEILKIFPDAMMEYEISAKITSDIFIPSKNLIIECYGDYWHCNPEFYSPKYFHKNCKIAAKELWERDNIREKVIRSNHELLIIWETNWNSNKDAILTKIKKNE